jgi:DNA-binding response OmpR family regulator
MQASILIIAEQSAAYHLRDSLNAPDFGVTILTKDGAIQAELVGTSYNLVIFDLQIPDGDGYDLLRRVRRDTTAPIIVILESHTDEDTILALGFGADQVITKPFVTRVLIARVHALLRRVEEMRNSPGNIVFGDYILDVEGRLLRRGEQRIFLTTTEFEVLVYLASRPGIAIRPDTIYSDVWQGADGDVAAVGVYIQRLRRKIERNPSTPEIIQTVHGSGYRFTMPDQTEHPLS